ncbi:protein of unknown function [Chryseobacterium sp. JV274]|nr:protein of unknown function [Chryseobacterium sp. JV274]
MLSENTLSFQKFYVTSHHFINLMFVKYNMIINKKKISLSLKKVQIHIKNHS